MKRRPEFRLFLKKKKTKKDGKFYELSSENNPFISPSFQLKEPVLVKAKEDWVDRIVKISALVAVVLAIGAIAFDFNQSKEQAKTFNSFQRKLDSTFNIQLENAKEQSSKTIGALQSQRELMKQQNDTTIQLLKTQADRLERQNKIWKINQRNEILTRRAQIAAIPNVYYLQNDTLKFRLVYSNSGQRTAKNVECKYGIFQKDENNLITMLEDDKKAAFSMNKIIPGNAIYWSITRKIDEKINQNLGIYIYSKFSYEDEMFAKRFIISNFLKIFKSGNTTDYTFCDSTTIDLIEKNSHYREINVEDFTIKDEFIFK